MEFFAYLTFQFRQKGFTEVTSISFLECLPFCLHFYIDLFISIVLSNLFRKCFHCNKGNVCTKLLNYASHALCSQVILLNFKMSFLLEDSNIHSCCLLKWIPFWKSLGETVWVSLGWKNILEIILGYSNLSNVLNKHIFCGKLWVDTALNASTLHNTEHPLCGQHIINTIILTNISLLLFKFH